MKSFCSSLFCFFYASEAYKSLSTLELVSSRLGSLSIIVYKASFFEKVIGFSPPVFIKSCFGFVTGWLLKSLCDESSSFE